VGDRIEIPPVVSGYGQIQRSRLAVRQETMKTHVHAQHRLFAACCIIVWLALNAATTALAQNPRPAQLADRNLQTASAAFSSGTPLPAWAIPTPAGLGENAFDGTAILYADTYFRVDRDPTALVTRVFQTHQASALAELGQYSIAFQPEYQKVELHTLRITRGDQTIDKLGSADIRFLQREQGLDAGELTGTVSALVLVDDLRVGDVLEITYSIIGQNPVYGAKFVDAGSWDASVPIRHRRVTLDSAEARNIRHRMIGGKSKSTIRPDEQRANGRRILRFEERNLPAVTVDTFIPQDIHPARWLQFSEFASWAEVAQWAAELMAPPEPRPDVGAALAAANGAATPADAVVKTLGFVQDEIRYLSIALGENSHRPYPPAQVLSRRYGDCKDKSALLAAALNQLGIEATPVLVSLQNRKGLDQLLPSPLVFDHVIVRASVGNKTYFLDATAWGQGRNLDHMGQLHAGAQFLPAAKNARDLEVIPQTTADMASRIEHVTVKKIDGEADLDVRFEYTGQQAEAIRRALAQMTAEQMRQAYQGLFDRRYTGATLRSSPEISDNREENRFAVRVGYRLPGFLERENDNWVARFRSDNLLQLFYVPASATRQHALAIPTYPSINRYEFSVTLPQDFDSRRQPSEQALAGRGFALAESISFTGRTIKLAQEMRITTDRIESGEVPQFLGDLRRVEKLLGGGLLVLRGNPQTVAAAPVSPEISATQRLERLLESTTTVIARARLQAQDFSATQCEHARTLAFLGRNAEALSNIQEAFSLQAATADLLKCSGEVRFTTGDFARSVTDLSRALAFQPGDHETLFFRGLSNYYLGKPKDAASDFRAAQTLAQDPAGRLRAGIWHALCARQSESDAADAGNQAEAASAWPAAALGLFLRQRTPDELLREAHRQPAERIDTALAEAYLYVGQHFLLAGDPVRAGVFLKRATEKGALHTFYHAAARHELARIDAARRPGT
jgi:lipoprotein NlpI